MELLSHLKVEMAAGSQYFTASQVGDLVTGEREDDPKFLFPGSDDDFNAHVDDNYDPLDREQGKNRSIIHQ